MANTFSASLVTDVARDTVMTVLQSKLAFLKLFSTDFSADELAPKKTIQVPKATVGATAQTNPTNYESGDTNLTNIAVSPDELSVSFHVTSPQLQQGFRLENLMKINLHQLANKVADVALTPVTTTNFGAAVVTAGSTAFDLDDIKTLYASGKNFNVRHLVIDGSYLAQIIPTDRNSFKFGEEGAYGFDRIAENNRWTGAGANIQGFVCDPQAIGVASGLPIVDDAVAKQMLINEIITIEQLGGLSIRFCVWGSLSTRAVWGSFGVMFGAAAGDTTALKLLASQ